MRFDLKFIFVLSASVFVTACGGTSSGAGNALSFDEKVKAAQDSVGTAGGQTNWKCVGRLDEQGQRFVAIASEHDFQKGSMIVVNRVTFAQDSSSRLNEGLILQHVSAYRNKSKTIMNVAEPVTNPQYPAGTKLFTYDRSEETLTFHEDVGGEKITKVNCKDRRVEKAK